MGLIISKALNQNKSTKENKIESKENNVNDEADPSEVLKTPTVFKKFEKNCISNDVLEYDQKKLLKSLDLDPRSPTIGIYRTPILVEDTYYDRQFNNYDSPVSIYSSSGPPSIVQDIMTPQEPPANVSGFDSSREVDNDFQRKFENPVTMKEAEKPVSLTVKDKPSTTEAKKLLQEIISANENCVKRNYTSSYKNLKVNSKSHNEKASNNLKVNLLKSRTPLSNITSSGNSPGPLIPSGKIFSRSKAATEFGSENSMSPISHHLAQWDKNTTVII